MARDEPSRTGRRRDIYLAPKEEAIPTHPGKASRGFQELMPHLDGMNTFSARAIDREVGGLPEVLLPAPKKAVFAGHFYVEGEIDPTQVGKASDGNIGQVRKVSTTRPSEMAPEEWFVFGLEGLATRKGLVVQAQSWRWYIGIPHCRVP